MKIALTGASGFVGKRVQSVFNDVVIIKREDSLERIKQKLHGVEVVINLAGSPIIKRWSESYKNTLLTSRIESTKKLVAAINDSDVKQLISTSAVGIYPDGVKCDEQSVLGEDFLAHLAKEWEGAALGCNKSVAIVRFGIVLGAEGGALKQMLLPFKLGLGGTIGDGSMMMSWIDIDDLMALYKHIIKNSLQGVFNATSPHPLSNEEYTKALGKILHRPTLFPIPIFMLKMIFGEGATVLIGSKEIYPRRVLESGFTFTYGKIEESLRHHLV